MPTPPSATFLSGVILAAGLLVAATANAKQPADLAGPWTLTFDKTGASCRVLLHDEQADTGGYALGMPTACRHAMPEIAAVGRWTMPDDSHLTLNGANGAPVLVLAAASDGYEDDGPDGTYKLTPVRSGRSAAAANPAGTSLAAPAPTALQRVASRHPRADDTEPKSDLAGRYAVMREKRDTGCMLTLDKTHAKGGDRAQLAPGCRDQGIVIFDPTAWQIVRGELVLTARAGHKTKLDRQDDGGWEKDPKEGGKPLGLKKL